MQKAIPNSPAATGQPAQPFRLGDTVGAVKTMVAELQTALDTLTELAACEIKYVIAYDPVSGYHWFVTNPWGPEDPEDWAFHALRSGAGPTLEAAVEQLAAAVVHQLPESTFALSRRP